ncbi:MAG TPA: recombinase family protein [Pirellulales bacterium]|nr:recombinase family protein [Pirellulales bacterium]
MQKIIAYYRVSTKKQGQSGLGLEAQQAAVEGFARQHGARIIGNYTEIESGKRADRPRLADAVGHAKLSAATLVVAKLDRLARNVAFLSAMMEAKVDFVACDNPAANKLTLHILAAVAEAEAEAISARTKAALTAYKARGGQLGASLPNCRNLTQEARERGAKAAGEAVKATADGAYTFLFPTVRQLRTEGLSYQAVADWLNAAGHSTRRGSTWTATAALRVCRRAGAA